jgi:hypothetical protein
MQNRESAIRSRMKKKETKVQLEAEFEFMKKENYRLFHENKSLKTEKNFLIEQIKFMQSLIKSNTLVKSTEDIEKNVKPDSPQIYMNGAKQRPFGKLFSVFVICVLSVAFVSFDAGNGTESSIQFGNSNMALNDVQAASSSYVIYIWYGLKFLAVGTILVSLFIVYNYICDHLSRKKKTDKFL